MPENPEADRLAPPQVLRRGEKPDTWFLDIEDAKRVTVLEKPDAANVDAYLTFAETCHHTSPGQRSTLTFNDVASGSTLWQLAELFTFKLRLEGLSRVVAHQLVRARVGWTFSETCTGDQDWRHGSFLVPRPWMRNPSRLEAMIQHALAAKHLYAAEVDDRGSPINARYLLPPNLSVFVHAHTNLAALTAWYSKRCCTMTQAWEMVVLAEAVRDAVIEVCPWTRQAFVNPCDDHRCWWQKAVRVEGNRANYYVPDAVHDSFEWTRDSFLYDGTPHDMNTRSESFRDRFYHGHERVR